ncbi:DNA cytosine methyltransferase [Pseudomonas syringae]|uniref:DNA cytosine methyltransferase n=1 Tax=Pseudomonas syringae TaxID=317 RepID=UPI000E322226|nr:DNA cytosine methyltransferase [Pseudomonas syringae]
MNELALFAGAGGGILGGHLLGWRTVCAVERDAYAAQVLAQRQNDGALKAFPIWSDVCSFDGRPWRGLVDLVSGGFPCQDISAAGSGIGIGGARSGLWKQMARIVGEIRPRIVYMENSPLLVGRGLAVVLGDLAEMGYDARWGIVGAADLHAPHQRDRIWIVAQAQGAGQQEGRLPIGEQPKIAELSVRHQNLAHPSGKHGKGVIAGGSEAQVRRRPVERSPRSCGDGFGRWPAEPGMGRVANGVANRVDRIKALGNGQVPRVAAAAFYFLTC